HCSHVGGAAAPFMLATAALARAAAPHLPLLEQQQLAHSLLSLAVAQPDDGTNAATIAAREVVRAFLRRPAATPLSPAATSAADADHWQRSCLRTLPARAARAISNAVATLLTRLVTDAAAASARDAARDLQPSRAAEPTPQRLPIAARITALCEHTQR